jgi:phospholipid-binding lipoprotein MlaA
MKKISKTLLIAFITLPLLLSVNACSTSKDRDYVPKTDKLEKMNRRFFKFNKKLDKAIIKPVTLGYKKVTPDFVEKGVSNFFSNLGDIKNAVNNTLQFKLVDAGNDMTRFAFNTVFGLGGFFDVATALHMEKHDEDFGQTLAKWGVKSGPYTVLPILGPSTLRNSTGFWVDATMNPANYSDYRTELTVVKGLDTRVDLLAAEKIIEEVTVDEYALVRDAWLQERAYKISDGKIDVTEQDDLASELEALN